MHGRRLGVAIAGFMATGKSTVGPLVAARLSRPFVDLDDVIVERAGQAIPEIFKLVGEPGFRQAESEALAAVLAGPPAVVALGGGAWHQESARSMLAEAGYTVVALTALWATVSRRLEGHAIGRPLAGSAEVLFEEREPGYRLADVVVGVDGLTPDEVARRVVAGLGVAA